MKNYIFIAVFSFFATSFSFAQETETLATNQNPNYKISQNKYLAKSKELTAQQGETSQETYEAIDEVATKRKNRIERRKNRALYRHLERMERAKHPNRYVHAYSRYGYNNYYNRRYSNRYSGFRSNYYVNPQTLFNLGVLGYLIFK